MVKMQVLRKRDRGDFDGFGKDHIKIGDFVVNQIAEDYRDYLRRFYLSGQALGVKTGETRDSVGMFRYKYRRGQWAVRPGVGVKGSLNYLKIFERGGEIVAKSSVDGFLMFEAEGQFVKKRVIKIAPRPFMKPSYQVYRASGKPREIMRRIYAGMAKRLLPEKGLS